jgi:hypothetical protein
LIADWQKRIQRQNTPLPPRPRLNLYRVPNKESQWQSQR